ncbi:MAG: ribosome-binding factor A [Actinobacteria bacterium]|nr:ribosome-binding factor A [Actinomycetota bacterium]
MNRPSARSSKSRTPSRNATTHAYPRSARLGETLREVLADELVRIDDERLEFVTITRVDVDPEMNRGIVHFDSLSGEDGDDPILEAFTGHRKRLQSAIAKQVRAKKTPILSFRPDDVIRSAERIEKILRENPSPSREATVNEDNYVQKKIFVDEPGIDDLETDDAAFDSDVDISGEA